MSTDASWMSPVVFPSPIPVASSGSLLVADARITPAVGSHASLTCHAACTWTNFDLRGARRFVPRGILGGEGDLRRAERIRRRRVSAARREGVDEHRVWIAQVDCGRSGNNEGRPIRSRALANDGNGAGQLGRSAVDDSDRDGIRRLPALLVDHRQGERAGSQRKCHIGRCTPRPPHTIMLVPVHTAVCSTRPSGASFIDVGAQVSNAGLYRPPELSPS